MLKELDRVVLTAPLVSEGLESGDVGTMVLVHKGGEAFEVEFMTLDGEPRSRRSRPPMCDPSGRERSSTPDSSPHAERR